MQQRPRSHGLDRPPLRSQRSSSISSDRASLSVAPLPFPPPVRPDPAYIAPIAASQIVTGDHESTVEEEEEYDGFGPLNALVAPAALALVNAFLDQLLYSFLAGSRSTSIASLRSSVAEVLKPRLAKDAIASADEELQEMGGGEGDGELSALHNGIGLRGDWDLNMIWQRTRLRCMVYTRLGDLEEVDEEMWIQREDLHSKPGGGRNRLSRDLGAVSPTSAIFLTSVLEFIGEQVLLVAGKAAYTRFEARPRQERYTSSPMDGPRPCVEVADVEKLAVSTTFGRLWRSWKKKVRSPSITSPRPSSREFLLRPASSLSTSESRSGKASIGDAGEYASDPSALPRPSTAEDRGRVFEAAATPLPATADDVGDLEGSEIRTWDSRPDLNDRPYSMMIASESGVTAEQLNGDSIMKVPGSRPGLSGRKRSSSLPHLASREFLFSQPTFSSAPKEGPDPTIPPDSGDGYPRPDANPSAITTMYDGAISRDQDATEGSEDETRNNTESSAQANARADNQDLDHGPGELAQSSNRYSEEVPAGFHAVQSSSALGEDGVKDRRQLPFQKTDNTNTLSAMKSLIDKSGFSQHRLGSKRMQGYTAGNASLDNRESAIVETTPQALAHEHIIVQPSNDEATRSDDQDDEHTLAELRGPVPSTSHDQVDGGSSSNRDPSASRHGSVVRSHPDGITNSPFAAPDQSPTFAKVKPGAKVSDIRKQLPPVSTGVERATVQRVSLSSSSAHDSPVRRTSTSSSREVRPMHTSGSISSQKASRATNIGGRESGDIGRQLAMSRTSSDGSGSIVRTPKHEETQRSFEQLIKSDETIQFTLTPQSVRETDSPESPRFSHVRTGTAELADFIRTSGPPPAETKRSSTARSIVSLKGLDALRSSTSVNSKPAPTPTPAPAPERPKMQGQQSRPTTTRSAHGAPQRRRGLTAVPYQFKAQ
ncbi:MAG: hypothetical protein Q9196_006661 [Gyalolechia fulgens]